MVRVFIKGGVWKNSEDEILKAAVMKYGKQQWARVASLLNRKSAKQCKARWNEWLDPSVRKVEWSRAEDERLLHLAKLLPAQWRTIGPIIGRTATQCQERYERLLDEAAAAAAAASGEDGGEATTATGVAAAASSSAVTTGPSAARRLRPGEIDPHPETKPARPDPVDMDEDEIEMLQEARARLANTQGKKAKRKQREKMLAEAKRLADLQKRRELKQAGLLSSAARTKLRKRSQEIDLGVEIPFHKPAPAGFHDTTEEKSMVESIRAKRLRDVDYKKLNEDQYRSRDRDAKLAQKKEEARLRSLERANMQLAVAEVSRKNDPIAVRTRGKLNMPEPAVSDVELAEVAKLSSAMMKSSEGLMMPPPKRGKMSVTDALLGDYNDRPLPTPMRTPASGGAAMSKSEAVMKEAENLRMIERGQTPLLGGENPLLNAGGTGTGASLKSEKEAALNAPTPKIVSGGPLGGSGGVATATPMQRSAANQTPMTLAVRDELGLNVGATPLRQQKSSFGDDMSVAGTDAPSLGGSTFADTATLSGRSIRDLAREERRAARRARKELELALASLPAPQFEYELAMPEAVNLKEDEEDEDRNKMASARDKDAADVDAEEERRMREEASKLYEARSSVLKREGELPRPTGPGVTRFVSVGRDDEKEGWADCGGAAAAENLVLQEMRTLIVHDAHSHPPMPVEDDIAAGAVNCELADKKKKKKGKKKGKKRKQSTGGDNSFSLPPPQPLEYFSEEALDAARTMLSEETDDLLREKRLAVRESLLPLDNRLDADEVDISLMKQNVDCSIQNAANTTSSSSSSKDRRLAQLEMEYQTIRSTADAIRKKCDKLQAKLAVRHGGYERRSDGLREEILTRYAELRHSQIEGAVYERLFRQEQEAVSRRTEKLQEEVKKLREDEAAMQRKYGDLMHERKRLLKKKAALEREA